MVEKGQFYTWQVFPKQLLKIEILRKSIYKWMRFDLSTALQPQKKKPQEEEFTGRDTLACSYIDPEQIYIVTCNDVCQCI